MASNCNMGLSTNFLLWWWELKYTIAEREKKAPRTPRRTARTWTEVVLQSMMEARAKWSTLEMRVGMEAARLTAVLEIGKVLSIFI